MKKFINFLLISVISVILCGSAFAQTAEYTDPYKNKNRRQTDHRLLHLEGLVNEATTINFNTDTIVGILDTENGGSGLDLSGETEGIWVHDGSTEFKTIAYGADGSILSSTGASTDPEWVDIDDVSSNDYELVSATTLSSAVNNLGDISIELGTTYRVFVSYKIHNNLADVVLRFGTSGSILSTGYQNASNSLSDINGTDTTVSADISDGIILNQEKGMNNADDYYSAEITLTNSGNYWHAFGTAFLYNDARVYQIQVCGSVSLASVTRFQVYSGNATSYFKSGSKVLLYKLNES